MWKKVDLANKIVEFWDIDTGHYESEIISYLNRGIKVKIHSACFNNARYVFIRGAGDQSYNSIVISDYRKKEPGENFSVSFK